MKRLIILRGNSGSGKTTVAKHLQKALGRRTMLISQDDIRRQVLRAELTEKHPTIKLVQQMTRFGWEEGWDTVIVEGIFTREKNEAALKELMDEADASYVFYFDIPFEETLRRHATKPNADEFGEKEMREWWREKDLLTEADTVISEELSAEQAVNLIANRCSGLVS